MAAEVIERNYKRPDRGIPDSWRRSATVNPPQSVHVSTTKTSAKAKPKQNQRKNPAAPVADAGLSINNSEPDADYAVADTSDAKAQSQESPRSNCSAALDADAFTNGLNEAVYLLF